MPQKNDLKSPKTQEKVPSKWEAVVKLILLKGYSKTNLTMFPPDAKKEILTELCEHYIRLDRISETLEILKEIDTDRFHEILKKFADECLDRGDYAKAATLYENIGDTIVAEVIRKNFLE